MKKEYIMIRTNKEEKTKIKKDAHRHEKTVSEYIRWLIEKERMLISKETREVEKK